MRYGEGLYSCCWRISNVSLFQDRKRTLRFQPLVNAPYQLITSGLKQLSGEAIRTCRFTVFKTHNRGFNLLLYRRRNLHSVIIDRLRNNCGIRKAVLVSLSPSSSRVEKCFLHNISTPADLLPSFHSRCITY